MTKYALLYARTPVGYYARKLIAISWKGGRCENPSCNKQFNPDEKNEASWQFAHTNPVDDHCDKTDRWGGRWNEEKPFTDAWLDFLRRVKLTCSQRCNNAVEGTKPVEATTHTPFDFSPTHEYRQTSLFECLE